MDASPVDRAPHEQHRRRALLLACGQFTDPGLPDLASPRWDAVALREVLGGPGGGYEVSAQIDSTAHNARVSITRFLAPARTTDLHLLYFSCHGVLDAAGDLYFAFHDTERDMLDATAVSADYVLNQIDKSRSLATIVLVDCCFSGAFLRGMRARGDTDAVLQRNLSGGKGVAVLTASGPAAIAAEPEEPGTLRTSYFTDAIVSGIDTGAADLNRDGRITVDELYEYVYERVVAGPSPQRPLKMGHMQGNVVVADVHERRSDPPVPPAAPPLTAQHPVVVTPPAPARPAGSWPRPPAQTTSHPLNPPERSSTTSTGTIYGGQRPHPRRRLLGWIASAVAAVGGALAVGLSFRPEERGKGPGVASTREASASAQINTPSQEKATATDPDRDTGQNGAGKPRERRTTSAPRPALADTGDVPVGGGVVLASKSIVLTQPDQGEFRAFSSTCTHQGCTLANVGDGTINCSCHGSKFSIADGSVTAGPATKGLAETQITVADGRIYRT
jgi:Rieske Fe-S protein